MTQDVLLPDIIMTGLNVLFVGYNPGMKSGQTGHHFAGPGNLFWPLLADAKLTGRRLSQDEDHELVFWKLGLVNLVDRPTPGSANLTAEELRTGGLRLLRTVRRYQPKVVAFLGKEIFRAYRDCSRAQSVTWGIQADGLIPGIWETVLPNPSRRSTLTYDLRLRYFRELKNLVEWGPHPR